MKAKLLYICSLIAMVCTPAQAAQKPNAADYTVSVHVRVSEFVFFGGPSVMQVLDATVNEKHCKLAGNAMDADVHGIGFVRQGLLPVGDYKAKLLPHKDFKPAYLNFDVYELLLPDGRTLQTRVVSLYE